MPYKRYYKRRMPYRRAGPRKKYGKRYGRKRFNRGFVKSAGRVAQNIKSLTTAKNCNIKLRNAWSLLSDTGSIPDYVFSGNDIVPLRAAANTVPIPIGGPFDVTTGDQIMAGLAPWAQFYDKYTCHGSAIRVEVNSRGTTTQPMMAVLVPRPYEDAADMAAEINAIKALTYIQLISLPNAKRFIIGPPSGGPNHKALKAFRKTKHMLGIKDVNDVDSLEASTVPINGSDASTPTQGFFWYLRLHGDVAVEYTATVFLDGYYTLKDRKDITSTVV